jgi:hypothetical protein
MLWFMGEYSKVSQLLNFSAPKKFIEEPDVLVKNSKTDLESQKTITLGIHYQ